MLIKVITNHKSLEYFIIIKNLIKRQIYWIEFLFGFSFVISYTSNKEKQKTDSLIYHLNDFSTNDNNDYQQY